MADKIDKGFSLSYWKLSYRRKFIRTLWMLPICIVVLVFFYLSSPQDTLVLGILVLALIVSIIQLVYNYVKWKAEERNRKNTTDCF